MRLERPVFSPGERVENASGETFIVVRAASDHVIARRPGERLEYVLDPANLIGTGGEEGGGSDDGEADAEEEEGEEVG